jgi:tetratricopeptide (TPR) repeat protein
VQIQYLALQLRPQPGQERAGDRGLQRRDLQAALADCNGSLRLRPSPMAFGTRGLVLLKLGRFDEAIADYDAELKINAERPASLYGRGVARRKKGDVAGGDADIAAAKALKGDVADCTPSGA